MLLFFLVSPFFLEWLFGIVHLLITFLFVDFAYFLLDREAIALAKVRLSSRDPILIELYRQWGEKQIAEGCYENAAKWYERPLNLIR